MLADGIGDLKITEHQARCVDGLGEFCQNMPLIWSCDFYEPRGGRIGFGELNQDDRLDCVAVGEVDPNRRHSILIRFWIIQEVLVFITNGDEPILTERQMTQREFSTFPSLRHIIRPSDVRVERIRIETSEIVGKDHNTGG